MATPLSGLAVFLAGLALAGPASAELPFPADAQCRAYPTGRDPATGQDIEGWRDAPVLKGEAAATPDAIVRAAARGPVIVVEADLTGRDFSGARLPYVCFERVDLGGARFIGATLTGAIFLGSNLERVDAARADLTGASIQGGYSDGLSLVGATLRGFAFRCALEAGLDRCEDEGRIDARDADLGGARFELDRSYAWLLDGAVLDRTVIRLGHVDFFARAQARGPVIIESGGYRRIVRAELSSAEWQELLAAWNRPSFACAGALTPVETRICAPDGAHLAALDRGLEQALRNAPAAGAAAANAMQRRWRARRDRCASTPDIPACLAQAYRRQIATLLTRSTPPRWLKPGTEALYVDSVPPVAPRYRATPAWRRLLPVIAASSWSTIHVRATGAGTIEATGHAFGAYAHGCQIRETLHLDSPSGWYRARADFPPPTKWVRILRLSGDDAELAPEGYDFDQFAGCGSRANWNAMTRIEATPETVAASGVFTGDDEPGGDTPAW